MQLNSVVMMLDKLWPTQDEVAAWVGVSRGLVKMWASGKYQPKPDDRAVLVKAVRKRAARLLTLADAVKREGHERAAAQYQPR